MSPNDTVSGEQLNQMFLRISRDFRALGDNFQAHYEEYYRKAKETGNPGDALFRDYFRGRVDGIANCLEVFKNELSKLRTPVESDSTSI